jgi:phage shock protein PspC (stress-responsive transcriptional regulator)
VPPTLDRLFAAVRRSPVVRSRSRVIAGVCAGLAEWLGISSTLVRVLAVIVAVFGPGVLLYLAAWLILPRYDGQIRLERAVRGGDAASLVLLVVTLLAIVPDVWGRARLSPVMFLVVAGLLLAASVNGWFRGQGRGPDQGTAGGTDPDPQRREPPPPAPGPQDAS